MKFARAILVLLCGLMLLPPPVSSAGAAGAKQTFSRKACRCANCSCCVESPAPDAPAIPAIPASNASSSEWTALLNDSLFFILAPIAPAPPKATPADPSLRRVAVPLYQRDCAYVI